jgi:hypothetical protein
LFGEDLDQRDHAMTSTVEFVPSEQQLSPNLPTTPGGFSVILADPPWHFHGCLSDIELYEEKQLRDV